MLLVLGILYLGVIFFPTTKIFKHIPEPLIVFAFIITFAFEIFFKSGPLSPYMLTTSLIIVILSLIRIVILIRKRQ